MTFMARLREVGDKQHQLLGRDRLTNRWVHAIGFEKIEAAREALRWLVEHNPGAFDSVQVIDAFTRQVVEQMDASELEAGSGPSDPAGGSESAPAPITWICPKCGSKDIDVAEETGDQKLRSDCRNCGHDAPDHEFMTVCVSAP